MKGYSHLKKVLITSLVLTAIQFSLILFIAVYILETIPESTDRMVYMLLIFTIVNGLLTGVGYYYVIKKSKEATKETIKDLEQLNSRLKEQRHDYLNHIQVIYGLMELEEFEEAKNYMQPVYKDILKLSKALKTSHPAINALLQAKVQVAEERNIDVFLEIKSNLKDVGIEPWELCKVLGNIIDNGIRALGEHEGEKRLDIEISESKNDYRILLINNGPKIRGSHQKLIFNEGFTTKQQDGHGMGLFIASRIIERAEGHINCHSSDERTMFEIKLPKMTV